MRFFTNEQVEWKKIIIEGNDVDLCRSCQNRKRYNCRLDEEGGISSGERIFGQHSNCCCCAKYVPEDKADDCVSRQEVIDICRQAKANGTNKGLCDPTDIAHKVELLHPVRT